ncbi:hypothetical protein [Wenxinia marina]|uniref:Wenxma_12, whole genome shotgun sequence n=1 Tax=Wenxinia marina DSM 24838 TaxID=1123501 RepID=A0A0D0PAF3_9RHOB|nr:hypothetical protein [Wenxinia marina]KIQ68481.1 hypothetical protein Wenmar_02751 [Wenxinia marina DSM 24838]GGL66093.1 hypothetical protein GCM10011392_20910 [Wenxinia marina]
MPSTPSPLRLLLAGGLGFAMMGALPGLYGLAIPAWTARFGAGGEGLVLTLHGFGSFLAVMAGLFGVRGLTIRVALLLLAAGAAGLGLGGGWAGVMAAAFVTGTGFGMLSLIVNRRFLTEFGARGPGMVGLVNAVYGVGAILAPQAVVLAGERIGPVYLGLAILLAAIVPVAQPAPRVPAAAGLPPLHAGRLSILGFVFAAVMLEVGLFGYGPSALLALDLPTRRVALLTSGFFAAFLLARLSLYWLADRVRPEHLFLGGFVGVVAAMAAAMLGAPEAGFALSGAAVGIQFPTFYVWAARVFGSDPRYGSVPLIGSLAAATLGPLLLVPVLAAGGATALFPAALAIAAVAAVALVVSLPRIGRLAAA